MPVLVDEAGMVLAGAGRIEAAQTGLAGRAGDRGSRLD
jgi:hypothetical protein